MNVFAVYGLQVTRAHVGLSGSQAPTHCHSREVEMSQHWESQGAPLKDLRDISQEGRATAAGTLIRHSLFLI